MSRDIVTALSFASILLLLGYTYWIGFKLSVKGESDYYIIDDTYGLGRRFDGIGAISGGGVST